MFVYFYWPLTGYHVIQAFHRSEKAAEFVLSQIESYIGTSEKKKIKKKELTPIFLAGEDGDPDPMEPQHDPDVVPAPPAAQVRAVRNPVHGNVQNVFTKKASLPKKQSNQEADEYISLENHLKKSKNNPTIDNALKAISLFEEYNTYILGNGSSIHTLEDTKVVE